MPTSKKHTPTGKRPVQKSPAKNKRLKNVKKQFDSGNVVPENAEHREDFDTLLDDALGIKDRK